jgi:hypothetical protein
MLQTMGNVLYNISIIHQKQSQILKESGSVHGGARSISRALNDKFLCA